MRKGLQNQGSNRPQNPMVQRIHAAFIHGCISLGIFGVFFYLIWFRWYPSFHLLADGGLNGIGIVAFVDLVLGPFLTFVVFNTKKSKRVLRFDIGCIAGIQLAALIWGFIQVYSQRPVAVVHFNGTLNNFTFDMLAKQDADLEDLARLGGVPPHLANCLYPTEPAEVEKMKTAIIEKGLATFNQVDWLVPFTAFEHQVDYNKPAMETKIDNNPKLKKQLDALLLARQAKRDDFLYLTYVGRYQSVILVFEPDGNLVDYLSGV